MITTPRTPFFLLLTLLCLPLSQALADELLMRDGSRLLGTVVKREGGTLEFKTSYAGVIKINWDEVSELRTEEPMKLLLEDKRTLSAQRIRNTDEGILVDDNTATEQALESPVEFINPDPWRTGDGYKLSGRVNFAFQKERGNTDKDEIDVDGDMTWRYLEDRVRLFGELERDRNNNKKTKDKWKISSTYDHFFSKKWYAGGALGLESDTFADLDLRTTVGPTAGYQWFEGHDMNLSLTVGPMYVKEKFIEAENNSYASFGWSLNFDKYLFDDFVQVYHRHTGLWNLEDTADLVWNTWTGLRFPLLLGLVATTEIQTEYNSGASKDAKELDTTYSLKLGYAW